MGVVIIFIKNISKYAFSFISPVFCTGTQEGIGRFMGVCWQRRMKSVRNITPIIKDF
ncbi:hypothetical protein [Akkermansia sp.]|uniref:hypothetical protein n=1 Tax=Akkermansia sp. TaxID=1872421 RepID=UPI0025B89394|nr:hypothetical protein [Akkermansia sp.]MCC8147643.1 hypothetical protein [Akkermansia sp.]